MYQPVECKIEILIKFWSSGHSRWLFDPPSAAIYASWSWCNIASLRRDPRLPLSAGSFKTGKLSHWGHAPCPPVVFTYARQKIWDVTFIMDSTICDGMDLRLVLFPRTTELHHVITMWPELQPQRDLSCSPQPENVGEITSIYDRVEVSHWIHWW